MKHEITNETSLVKTSHFCFCNKKYLDIKKLVESLYDENINTQVLV